MPDPDGPTPLQAKRLYNASIRLVESGFGPPDMPAWIPIWLARVNAFLQLVGAGLLAIGMFSRLWAAGLLAIVGVAFYPHAGMLVGAIGLEPIPTEQFQLLFSHVGLIVLAIGIVLTGAGGMSVDRIIFNSDDLDGDLV